MQNGSVLDIGPRPYGDGFGIVSPYGAAEPDGGIFLQDDVADDGGVGCDPGGGCDSGDVGSQFVYSFHDDVIIICGLPTPEKGIM